MRIKIFILDFDSIMARASSKKRSGEDLRLLTDCMFFVNGHCKLDENCKFRHCRQAAAQTNHCFKWPRLCRNVHCPYRHPATTAVETKPPLSRPSPPAAAAAARQEILISFFWDIENVPIPKGQRPFDIVQRIREKLLVNPALRENSFSCYCDSTSIPQENQMSLSHANVRIAHVPGRKPGAVDREIMLDLDRFERAHRPPATIVLISGDIDFVGKLSDLRHQAGFTVIVIHNKPAKQELKATVNAHYPWEAFTQATAQPPSTNGITGLMHGLAFQASSTSKQSHHPGSVHRVDRSPHRASPTRDHRPPRSAGETKKQSHACAQCTSEFDSSAALRQHQEAKDHVFDCPMCDERFFTLDGQTQHQKVKNHHRDDFLCEQCNRRFDKFERLTQHRQSTGHLGRNIPLPQYGFSSSSTPTPPQAASNRNERVDSTAMIIQRGIEALIEHWPSLIKQ